MIRSVKVGDWVTWASQANGSPTKKTGMVVAVVPEGLLPVGFDPRLEAEYTRMFDLSVRTHESYLVEVKKPGRKPMIYRPRVKDLVRCRGKS